MALVVPTLAFACRWPGSTAETSAAAPVTEIGPGTGLDDALAMLYAQLDTAAAGLDEAGTRSLGRVKAISDRLLETSLPFAWLSAESYSLEARLRQIQTRVDRMEALRQGGARRDDVVAGLLDLSATVGQLRNELAAGGTVSPVPVGVLLDSLDRTSRARR